MADHFVGLNRGQQGLAYSDWTTGAASTASLKMELRVTDSSVTKKDVMVFLESLETFIANAQESDAAGFVFLNN